MVEARRLTRWDGRNNLVEDGRCVATWERSHWATGAGSISGGAAPWRHEERLHDGGRRLGSVRRTGVWRGDAAADLPGLPRVVEVLAIAMSLTRWESDAAATG